MTGWDDRVGPVVGGRTASGLADSFGIETVGDLLSHYPRRYVSQTALEPIGNLVEGEHVTIVGQIVAVNVVPPRRSRAGRGPGPAARSSKGRLEVTITDGSAEMRLTFFNQIWRSKDMVVGRRALFSGRLSSFRRQLQLTNPQYSMLDGGDDRAGSVSSRTERMSRPVIPIYPASAKMSSWGIASAIDLALPSAEITETLPPEVLGRHGLMPRQEALRAVHHPRDLRESGRARRRLKFDEALILQAALASGRLRTRRLVAVPRPSVRRGVLHAFDERLPFRLTQGQRSVSREIADDLARSHPMHRLLQGDVGSGKTVVALRAMLQVCESGGQAVLIAPTEVLAQQHHTLLTELLGEVGRAGTLGAPPEAVEVALLTGSASAVERRRVLSGLKSGSIQLAVGTHSLLQESVGFLELALIVIDEQHRFGVEQRSALVDRGGPGSPRPHLLVMTATPIPRTVAMTVFGDLETSTLTERPAGRQEVASHVVGESDPRGFLNRAWERVSEEVAAGHQVFVVCSRITSDTEESGSAGAAAWSDTLMPDADPSSQRSEPHAVNDLAPRLAGNALRGLRIGRLHGGMSADEKESTMAAFAAGPGAKAGIDVLVSTTVIEVGVDIPTASMMVIMDADRFGVSQLHQLRGRVGRGGDAAVCLFVTCQPAGTPARERLEAVAATNDGFALARLDLQQRREGNVLGERQSGRTGLKLLSVIEDEDLILAARQEAETIVGTGPGLDGLPTLARLVTAFERDNETQFLDKT